MRDSSLGCSRCGSEAENNCYSGNGELHFLLWGVAVVAMLRVWAGGSAQAVIRRVQEGGNSVMICFAAHAMEIFVGVEKARPRQLIFSQHSLGMFTCGINLNSFSFSVGSSGPASHDYPGAAVIDSTKVQE